MKEHAPGTPTIIYDSIDGKYKAWFVKTVFDTTNIDSFIDGELTREARDQRLTAVDRGIRSAQEGLAREAGAKPPAIEQLIEAFAPLAEWEYWTREQKRSVLSTLVPEIRVADYKIESLGLNPLIFSNEDTHRDMGSSRRPA